MATTDLYLDWQGDAVLTQTGSVQMATGWDLIRQRILRRMITNPSKPLLSGRKTAGDYIFDTIYGFGVGAFVGQDLNQDFLAQFESLAVSAVEEDTGVDSSIPPSVTFTQPQPNMLICLISVPLINAAPGTIALQFGG